MSYTYINRKKRGYYATFDEPLNENYAQTTSLEEYKTSNPAPWMALSEDQVSFHEENPTASVDEVVAMTINPDRLVSKARQMKSSEISQAREALRSMKLDGGEIYAMPYERQRALMDNAMKGSFVMSGRTWDEFEGKSLINVMDFYDNEADAAYRTKLSELNSKTTVEDIEAIDASSGFPDTISLAANQVKVMGDGLRKDSPEATSVTFSKRFINDPAISIPEEEALTFKSIYPVWGEEYAELGKAVEPGFRLRVVKRDDTGATLSDILYEVIQPHSLQADWEPGVSTASLYKSIDVEHAGTMDDPIPFTPPMILENGKYYKENDILYICERDSVIPLTHSLSELASSGQYVSVVEND